MIKGSLTKWFLLEKNYNNMGVVVALWEKKTTNKNQNSNETSNGTSIFKNSRLK
jgi:hypothetical protein